MASQWKGRCLCGAVHYESREAPMMLMKCHCRDCHYISGGEAAAILVFPKEAVSISGELKTYKSQGISGGFVYRRFCPNCGTQVYSEADASPGPMMYFKAGTMDSEMVQDLKTAMVFWTDTAYPFSHIDAEAQTFAKNPVG